MSECPVCQRNTIQGSEFCEYHDLASKNVKTTFENWKTALDIAWNAYLSQLLEEETLGKFAREFVEYLIQQDGS